MEPKPHVVIVPSPWMGHLFPFIELAKQLVLHHNFSITFIISTAGPPSAAQKSILESLPEEGIIINHIFLPHVSFDDLPNDVKIQSKLSLTVIRSLPLIRQEVKSLLVSTSRIVALLVDLFSTDAIDVAKEFNIPPYLFFTSAHFTLSLSLYLQKLDQLAGTGGGGQFRDMPEPVKIPGSAVPVHARDLPDSFQDRTNDAYKWALQHTKRFYSADGIILNSFRDSGAEVVKALQEQALGNPPVYPIGPLIGSGSSKGVDGSESEMGCLKWLDRQPSCSVLYVAFGSGGTLSREQLNELAFGLEMSEQSFLWVVRSPDDKSASGSYFSSGQSNSEPSGFLPQGFLERTKARGLVVPSWAPQIEILSHGSTAGFLSHCGWNSILESVVHGVPLIAWPLYAEQKLNAVMLTEDMKVASRPKANENGLVGRDEIAKVVKGLLKSEEGVRIREQMRKLKDAAAMAVGEDGSSTKSLTELVLKLKNPSL